MTQPFAPEVVAAILRHMNDDHVDDALLICRSLGGHPEATGAATTGLDGDGIDFEADGPDGAVAVRIPWSAPITSRAEVRAEVVRLYEAACAVAGIPPRGEGGGT